MAWEPHVTVAAVIEKDGKYLIVEEKSEGRIVFNQPAGHVDGNETLAQATLREIREETGWDVTLESVLGIYVYTSPTNGVTYYRICFVAKPVAEIPGAELDTDIIRALWMSEDEIRAAKDKLRSPMVLKSLDDFKTKPRIPLDFIYELHPDGWLTHVEND